MQYIPYLLVHLNIQYYTHFNLFISMSTISAICKQLFILNNHFFNTKRILHTIWIWKSRGSKGWSRKAYTLWTYISCKGIVRGTRALNIYVHIRMLHSKTYMVLDTTNTEERLVSRLNETDFIRLKCITEDVWKMGAASATTESTSESTRSDAWEQC